MGHLQLLIFFIARTMAQKLANKYCSAQLNNQFFIIRRIALRHKAELLVEGLIIPHLLLCHFVCHCMVTFCFVVALSVTAFAQ